jgi:hypothetical protein
LWTCAVDMMSGPPSHMPADWHSQNNCANATCTFGFGSTVVIVHIVFQPRLKAEADRFEVSWVGRCVPIQHSYPCIV